MYLYIDAISTAFLKTLTKSMKLIAAHVVWGVAGDVCRVGCVYGVVLFAWCGMRCVCVISAPPRNTKLLALCSLLLSRSIFSSFLPLPLHHLRMSNYVDVCQFRNLSSYRVTNVHKCLKLQVLSRKRATHHRALFAENNI